MDIIVCTPKSRLLAQAIEALCTAFEENGARISWVQSLEPVAHPQADVVILSSEANPAKARRLFRGARIVEVSMDGARKITAVWRKASYKAPDLRLDLFPRSLNNKRKTPPSLIAPVSTAQPMDEAPVWLHAMPKDVQTLVLFPKETPHTFESIWSRATASRPCNVICFSQPDPALTASNVYFKPVATAPDAFAFAQLAIIEDDEERVWHALSQGVPVVHVSDTPNDALGFTLQRLGLGASVATPDVDTAASRILASPRYRNNASAYAERVGHAADLDSWATHICAQVAHSQAPRRLRAFRPSEAI